MIGQGGRRGDQRQDENDPHHPADKLETRQPPRAGISAL